MVGGGHGGDLGVVLVIHIGQLLLQRIQHIRVTNKVTEVVIILSTLI